MVGADVAIVTPEARKYGILSSEYIPANACASGGETWASELVLK